MVKRRTNKIFPAKQTQVFQKVGQSSLHFLCIYLEKQNFSSITKISWEGTSPNFTFSPTCLTLIQLTFPLAPFFCFRILPPTRLITLRYWGGCSPEPWLWLALMTCRNWVCWSPWPCPCWSTTAGRTTNTPPSWPESWCGIIWSVWLACSWPIGWLVGCWACWPPWVASWGSVAGAGGGRGSWLSASVSECVKTISIQLSKLY